MLPYPFTHRWTRKPRPQPRKFSKLMLLIQFSQSCICLNWLSGALIGVGGSDFIGRKRPPDSHRARADHQIMIITIIMVIVMLILVMIVVVVVVVVVVIIIIIMMMMICSKTSHNSSNRTTNKSGRQILTGLERTTTASGLAGRLVHPIPMYVYVYMHTCLYIYIYIYMSIYIYMYMYMYTICMQYVCLYIYIYIYMYMYIYIYICLVHPIPITRFWYFRTQPLENLSTAVKLPIKKKVSGQPNPWKKSHEENCVMGTGCMVW